MVNKVDMQEVSGLNSNIMCIEVTEIINITKEKTNKMVSSFLKFEGWKITKNIAGGMVKNSTGGRVVSSFGKSLGSLF